MSPFFHKQSNEKIGKQSLTAQYRELLVRYLGPFRIRVGLLASLMLVGTALQLLNPQILRYFIDAAQAGLPLRNLMLAALLFLGVALVDQGFSVAATYVSQSIGWSATNMLRTDLMRHCLSLDLGFHNQTTPGVLIERIDGDVSALANFLSQFMLRVVGSILTLGGIVFILFRIDWRVGAGLGVFAVLTLVVMLRLRDLAVPHSKAERQASAILFGFLEERLSGLADIKANGAGHYVMRRYFEIMRDLMRKGRKAWTVRTVSWSVSTVMIRIGMAIGLGVGVSLYQSSEISLGTVYLIFHYTEMLFRPLDQIAQQMQDLQRAGAGVSRIMQLFSTHTNLVDEGTKQLPHGAPSVEFTGVSFGYADDGSNTLVLDDVSFHQPSGQVLGVLGRTGSGKSTITRLLLRFYEPTTGHIRINGINTYDIPLTQLRSRVGMVTQEVQLFHGTVRDNLTLFDPSIPDERLYKALAELGLTDWLNTLPRGLDAVLEPGGGGLSAGEAQLLAFTRVFLKDPGLVILDEASSRLDPATEQLLELAVGRLLAGRTGIIIAHRLATVRRADAILILENGAVQEYGSRQALEEDPTSHFAGLLRTGLESFGAGEHTAPAYLDSENWEKPSA